MKFTHFALSIVFLTFIGCACNDHKDKGSIFLKKDYDFVLGFAIPDEDRLVPTEVFVGRILDHEVEELFLEGMQDSFLLEQVQRYYSWYRGEIIYHEDAEVYIFSESQRVKLTHTGFGTYRDINNELHIEPLKQYTLEVYRPGDRYYTAQVYVPGNFNVANFADGDTVGPLFPKKPAYVNTNVCRKIQKVIWSASESTLLYRTKSFLDSFSQKLAGLEIVKTATFQTDNQGVLAMYDTEDPNDTIRFFKYEILALDSSASIFYQSEGLGLHHDVDSFLSYWNDGNIEKRSHLNTHGTKDAIGNFGAYNAVRIHFWVTSKKDSCDIAEP